MDPSPAAAPFAFGTGSRPPDLPPWIVDGAALFREATGHAAQGRLAAAVAAFDRLIRLQPDHADALNDRGNALDLLRRRTEALASYEAALAVRPDHIHALNGRANMLQAFGRLDEALAGYDAALARDSNYVHAWNGRGNTLMACNRHREALQAYLRAQSIQPTHPDANFNEGLARLSLGDFELGWIKHERRWDLPFWRNRRRGFTQPLWRGETEPAGRTVLLHAEQGFGDTLQFCRYVPRVAARGLRVVLEVQPALRALLAQVPGVSVLLARGEDLPAFDVHCPLLSLPMVMATRLDSIPPMQPLLLADPAKVQDWAARLGPRRRPRIGLAWQGNASHDNDRNRSIALAQLAPLLAADADFISLQQQVPERDRELMSELTNLRDAGRDLHDFTDTAALVANLDCVIAVDTSVAHLAGAMGTACWLMLPWVADWRWMLEREDTPWYPQTRLFRQDSAGDWVGVVGRLQTALAQLIG
ncbi:MAG TPA: tetratricopeptide repeat protein [Burkholderiaceae bacterium]|nr:tetratricopeptide repeat protein [Burkholderiaceae bacterium]